MSGGVSLFCRIKSVTAGLLICLVAKSAFAATLTTTNVQAGGTDWNAAIWKTNGTGTAVPPFAGNIYRCVSNGIAFGNGTANTRIRNPTTGAITTFPGDSLTLTTNTEIRIKGAATGPVLNFPGVGGNPGLILDGGILNVGDDFVFGITGKVQVVSLGFICPGDNGGGRVIPARGVNITGQLVGTGTMFVFQAGTTVAQQISGNSNNFSGRWVVKAGWLLASGANSLGTNSITIDPNYALPLSGNISNVAGPAIFEPGYDLNSAGTLTLTNGGVMKLHQNCLFSAVRIEGSSLSQGTHYYPELTGNFPSSFAADGSGSLTVQPYGPPPSFPPTFVQQPQSLSLPAGSPAQLTATAAGATPLSYQWQKGTNAVFVSIADGSTVTGSRTNTLSFGSLASADAADYRLLVTNLLGAATSQVATLTVTTPTRPAVSAFNPPAGSTLGTFYQLGVTFSVPVTGVEAQDLQVNGVPATSVSGSGSSYLFTFTQPWPGLVSVGWDPDAVIVDSSGIGLDTSGTWSYTLVDNTSPTLRSVAPVQGALVSSLTQAQVVFSEPVTGVEAGDLLVNGVVATAVAGAGFGPYVFQFVQPSQGAVGFTWATAHNIRDLSSNLFVGTGWTVQYSPLPASQALTNVVINEFLAANVLTNGLLDEDRTLSDWIEIYNRGQADVNLAGWSLTDTLGEPGVWTFPATNLPAGTYLVVFASGKNRRVPGSNLHTSFALGLPGEYLGLFNADYPPRVAHEYAPAYPEQRNDISYGLDANRAARYFSQQTPGGPNSLSTLTGAVAAVHFSVARGWFDRPFNLVLTTTTPGAAIRYTVDGSIPTETSGTTYAAPLVIDHTTTLQAAAFAPGQLPSVVQTHTYIFIDDTLNQPPNPPGFPISTLWSTYGWPSDYGMDSGIVNAPLYGATIRNDLMSLPALSIVMETEAMFGDAYGLYTHPLDTTLEAPCSVELISPDGREAFQCTAGIQMHGGGSRARTLKHPFRLSFRSKYGAGSLKETFFPDSPVREFDKIDLRSDYNNHWNHGFEPAQRARGGLVRDAFVKDLHASMGALSSHSRYVHLYINGLYWGIYNPCERPDADFAASYLGGSKTNYDAFNGTGAELVDGDAAARTAMLSLNNTNLASLAQYEKIQQYLDIPQFIDYMIVQLYGANWDWGSQKNWYAIRRRESGAGFKYLCWDSERTLEGLNDKVTVSPDNLQANLVWNSEYRLAFADRVHRHFFNGGALTPGAVMATWQARASQIDRAIVLESARWGDSVPNGKSSMSPLPYPAYTAGTPYTREENWLGERGRLFTNYFPYRSGVVVTQFMQSGLYPAVTAPGFNQHGGYVPSGFNLTMAPVGTTIYYTTDGSDPRLYGIGTPSPSARVYTSAVPLLSNVLVRARSWNAGTWSALNEASFSVSAFGTSIRITEIMYRPIGGDAYEYIELQNTGSTAVDMSGWSFDRVSYVFPTGTVLGPGGLLILASAVDPAAFAARYPTVAVGGYYGGSLANNGERLALLDRYGHTVTSVDYSNTGGWPAAADGLGYSLEILGANLDPDDPANWRASTMLGGSPGLPNPASLPPAILINEIMADNAGAVTNGGAWPDWLELHNPSSNAVSIANWSLSNGGNPRKFVFPAGASIPASGFLVVWCDSDINAPGLHTGFALGRKGESIFLYDNATNRVDAVGFGLQIPNYSIGRVGTDGRWQLNQPTPGTVNVATAMGEATNLSINEWLANAAPGTSDWIELFNRSSTLPVSLSGLYFATSNQLFQLRSLSFVAPRGFVQLFADEAPGPDHLDFKLAASGDSILVRDASGLMVDSVNYAQQLEGVSQGRFPDGSANVVSFPGTASPGASNYLASYSGPILNELMARNSSIVYDARGNNPDWVELCNPASTAFDLAGMRLSPGDGSSYQWAFPPGSSIAGGGYLRVWCDPTRPPSSASAAELNTGFALEADGDNLFLLSTNNQVVDAVKFGFQVADRSIGRSAGSWTLLDAPTPGSTNSQPASLGSQASVRINEWMADPLSGDDWFELYSADALPVSMAGLSITDDPSIAGITKYQVPPLSYIASHSWVKFVADAHPANGPSHVPFRLNKDGQTLLLYGPGLTEIDGVDYGLQSPGTSQGRLPDGAPTIVAFPDTPTPRASNYLPLGNIFINEVLTHTDPPLEDAIELYNASSADVSIAGWFISNSESDFKKLRIPSGTLIPGKGYKVFYEYEFNGTNDGPFTFNSAHGDSVFFSQSDSLGNLSGYRAQVTFGAAANGVSWGRFITSAGNDFVPLASRSFGADDPVNLAQFRLGQGLTNSPPKIGPVVINEVMYHPVAGTGTNVVENPDEEFVELRNITAGFVPLYDASATNNTWSLRGAIAYNFPPGVVLSPGAMLLIVHFDPVLEAQLLANFVGKYGLSTNTAIFGPYSGKLDNGGETIELYRPDSPQAAPHPDAGFVPAILVDRIAYAPVAPWPDAANGTGFSLQRRRPDGYGNEPLNWIACTPTPASLNCGIDSDNDGLPDDWELAHQLNPASSLGDNGANGDPDHDGFTNIQEYLAGTDPQDPSSYLSLTVHPVAGGVGLRFLAAAAHSYTVQYREDLAKGTWQTLYQVEPAPSGHDIELFDLDNSARTRFYRLVTPRLP